MTTAQFQLGSEAIFAIAIVTLQLLHQVYTILLLCTSHKTKPMNNEMQIDRNLNAINETHFSDVPFVITQHE